MVQCDLLLEPFFCGPFITLWAFNHVEAYMNWILQLKTCRTYLEEKKLKRKKKTNWCWSVFYFYPALTFSSGKRNVNLREKTEYYSANLLSSFMLFLCLCVICFAWNCFGIHRICTTFNFNIDISNEQQHPNIVKYGKIQLKLHLLVKHFECIK